MDVIEPQLRFIIIFQANMTKWCGCLMEKGILNSTDSMEFPLLQIQLSLSQTRSIFRETLKHLLVVKKWLTLKPNVPY